jgi:SAM-dependent methyltransferase
MNAFDSLAADYDTAFTQTPIASHLRQRTHASLTALIRPGDHILELGCGTGEDAVFAASLGAHVVAADASTAMLALAARKAGSADIHFIHLDLNHLPDAFTMPLFDGVFSNFGPVNCVSDRAALAAWLHQHTAPGAFVALGVMPPLCAWEFLWHAAHRQWSTATRRLRVSSFWPDGASAPVEVRCPSPSRLKRDFAPYFQMETVMPLGVLLPHTAAYPVVIRRPRMLRTLLKWDAATASMPWLANFADHYWIVFRRSA